MVFKTILTTAAPVVSSLNYWIYNSMLIVLKFKVENVWTNSAVPDQAASEKAVSSGSSLFATCILRSILCEDHHFI